MASEAYARANELYIDEEYERAGALYDEAVKLDASVGKYYLTRAANRLKLRDFMEVITDIDKAQQLSLESPVGWFRKGQAYFGLNEFESALASFEQASSLGPRTELWIRKCQAEIRKETGERPVVITQTRKDAPAESAKKLNTEVAVESSKKLKTETPPDENKSMEEKKSPMETGEDKPPETLATKVKPNWTQNQEGVQITLFAKNLSSEKVRVDLNEGVLRAVLSMPDGSMFDHTWTLYAPVQEEKMRVKVNAFKVEIGLDKAVAGDWRGLEATAKPDGIKLRENDKQSGRVPAPYTSNKDWNQVEETVKQEEKEEKPEGNDALQKLFQQIYADADPETRRAMMKSYQTSGGTVLNCNWKEVAKKDYEKEGITPPKGQEVRKWGD